MKYDFSGYVTRNDILCTDGRTIRRNAFQHNDGATVPLVWNHQHNNPNNVLGKVFLQNREDGVYGYAQLNETDSAKSVRELIRHGDIDSFSIYANQLKQSGKNVLHGDIKEVSLVLAGANSGAKIENAYFEHSDGSYSMYDGEATIYTGGALDISSGEISHADKEDEPKEETKEESKMPNKDRTIQDVIDSMDDEQKQVLYFLVGLAMEGGKGKSTEEESEVKHNVFDNDMNTGDYIQHGEELRNDILMAIDPDNRSRNNITSLKDFCMHAADEYGIDDIEFLFPDARTLTNTPEFVKREDDWVDTFMNGTKHTPFSRIKTMFADITADDARAKGYTKGNKKLEEVFSLLKREVSPTTIYKKQKLDRDDITDITDFDVVVWLKTEMRMMLNEEIARAALVGDGRTALSTDKIKEDCIIPIWKDDEFYSIKVRVPVTANATDDQKSEAIIKAVLKARKNYKGSGNPTFYTTEDVLTDMLLIEDGIGRRKYETTEDVARALRCSKVVTVPVMEGLTRTATIGEPGSQTTETRNLIGIIVNPIDYSFGADKGGAVNMFDDFDIDFNQQKYLMETRCSGMLTKPYSAMAIETVTVANG